MEDLPQEFFIKNSSINIEVLNIRTGEITAGAYLVSITEIVSDCQQIGTGARLIINNYILGVLWENQYFFLFDSHSKDEIGRMSAAGTVVSLKFDSLRSLENYIKSVYYSNYPTTLYFQVQFLKLKCTDNANSAIKNALKKERKKSTLLKYHQGPEKKCKKLKRDIIEIHSQEDSIKKGNIRKILNNKKNVKKRDIRKILSQRKNMKKRNLGKILNKKEDMKKIYIWTIPDEKENMKKTNARKILNQKENLKKNKYEENPEPKREFEKSKYEENPKPKREYEKTNMR